MFTYCKRVFKLNRWLQNTYTTLTHALTILYSHLKKYMCHYCRCRWISLIYLEIENDRIRNEYGCDNTKNKQHVTMSYKWDLICSTIGFTDISNNSKDSSRG